MKKAFVFLLAILLSITAFAGLVPTSAASVDTLAPLSVKADTAPIGDYFEPCYDEPLDIFYTLYGDADMDGTVTIKDATIIQKAIAQLVTMEQEAMYLSDVTGDLYITINDATAIQKYIAGVEAFFPVFTKYAIPDDKISTEFECNGTGFSQIDFTLAEDGFYKFDISGNGGTDNVEVILCDAQGFYITTAIAHELYNTDLSMGLPLTAGEYKVIVYTTDSRKFYGRINHIKIEDDFYFRTNKDDAVELKTFQSDTISAKNSGRLYKIHNDTGIDDTLVFYPTIEGRDVFITVYSDNMEILGTFNTIYNENLYIHLNTLNLPKDKYFYIYAYAPKSVNGDNYGFTAHLTTHTQYILEDCSYLECDSSVKVQGTEFYLDEGYAGIGYRFTPTADGYYKFLLESEASTCVTYASLAIYDERVLDYDESSIISYKDMTLDGKSSDYVSAYLYAGQAYYIYGSAHRDSFLNLVTLTASACTKEEYEQSYTEIPKPIEIPEAEDIFVGDTKAININAEDGEIIYKFTPDSTDELIFYSEGEGDPWISIYDSYGNHIAYEDDIFYREGKLNFALYGYVDAGETYYIGVACHDEAETEVTFSIVRKSDYNP